ncbi:hypothetical protein [Arcicella rigui]|uniref:Uncharacterized protein n=1 Tax=Arcicella rigui TaxID=797020 RepID=A0ABU5QA81_9BACT|nr:hypothetical protein [Arcicella rigui]MEA5139743.1 hypothetical protein [Arcicella rigui]
MEININEEYSGFEFENGYIILIDNLIKLGLITDIFKRSNSLILLKDDEINGGGITYFIRESDLMEFYNDLKSCFNQNLSPDLNVGLTSLKKWIERSYHNSGRVSYESLMSEDSNCCEIIIANGSIIDYPQTKNSSLSWSQDEYSYYNLMRQI